MCLPLACFETGFGFVSGFDEGYHGSKGIFQKKSKIIDEVIESGSSMEADFFYEVSVGIKKINRLYGPLMA